MVHIIPGEGNNPDLRDAEAAYQDALSDAAKHPDSKTAARHLEEAEAHLRALGGKP